MSEPNRRAASQHRSSRERGSVAIEMALVTPIALMIILGGVHVGLALGTQHRLADATAFAATSSSSA